jgi:uncharacterized protein
VRVVFDTNIFISAFVFPGGRAEEAIRTIIEGPDVLVLSSSVIKETLAVLAAKFGQDKEALSRTAVMLADLAEIVKPSKRIAVLADDPDNRVLECALAGRAGYIVTGDKEMLKLGEYEGIKIITLKEFLEG